jgi:hypothetical protein
MSSRSPIAVGFASMLVLLGLVRGATACDEEPGRRCKASSEREAWMEGRFDTAVRSGSTGGRISTTRLQGSDADDTGHALGLTLSGHSERYGAHQLFNVREASFAFIGGGSLGFEGGLGADIAAGVRVPVARNHGPFFRLGMRGHLLGNDKLYTSLLEIPQLQLGYQSLRTDQVFELAGRVGPVLAGRFNTGDDAERKLGKAFEMGGHLAVHVAPIHFELEHTHVLMDGPLGDVDLLSTQLCGDAWVLQLCVDTRVGRGDAAVPDIGVLPNNPVTSYFGGLSIGVRDDMVPMAHARERRPDRRRPANGIEPAKDAEPAMVIAE